MLEQKSVYQQRVFLNLIEDSQEADLAKKILKSPLGLADELIKKLFSGKLQDYKFLLDEIKGFAAGINRAENLSEEYSLAKLYPNFFAFHQFFQSSFRARQGKVLEKILMKVLQKYVSCEKVPETPKEINLALNEIFQIQLSKLDLDVLGIKEDLNKALLIQIRSRDDTGGTTAKGSLVDLLREILRKKSTPQKEVLYLISIWDARNSQQKKSLIDKIFSSLENLIKIKKKRFSQEITKGIQVTDKITLKLTYGTEELVDSLLSWSGNSSNYLKNSISTTISLIEQWDDLWISYAIASLELEAQTLNSVSNIDLLNQKFLQTSSSFDFSSYKNLVKSIDTALEKIIPLWKENSIPLISLSDKVNYIRDLLFLKACYEK